MIQSSELGLSSLWKMSYSNSTLHFVIVTALMIDPAWLSAMNVPFILNFGKRFKEIQLISTHCLLLLLEYGS